MNDDTQESDAESDQEFEAEPTPIRNNDNQFQVSLSWSLAKEIRQLASREGVSAEDLAIELLADGMARRSMQDSNRATPSHLMTRNGYVHDDSDPASYQPQLSHHQGMNRPNQKNGNGNTSQPAPRYQKNGNGQHQNRYHQNNANGNSRYPSQQNGNGFRSYNKAPQRGG